MVILKQKAFTLIELLVTIAIVGLLASIVLVSLQGAAASARDGKRDAEAGESSSVLRKTLEVYHNANNAYPWTAESEDEDGCCLEGNDTIKSVLAPYVPSIPEDPLYKHGESDEDNEYCYRYKTVNNGEEYKIRVSYETGGYKEIASWGGGAINYWTCGDALSYGGQDYATVLIGTQCWMAENLNVTNGNTDQSCSLTKYCYFEDFYGETFCDIYGGLYTWDDMMCGEGSSNSEPSGVQGICPNGWHIPGHYEWITLERQICSDIGNSNCDTTFPRDFTIGIFGQDTNTAEGEGSAMAGNEPLWTNGDLDNAGAGNNDFGTSGFTGLPAGYRKPDGNYSIMTYGAYLWSSSENDVDAWHRGLYYTTTNIGHYYHYDKSYGFSVRCLKD